MATKEERQNASPEERRELFCQSYVRLDGAAGRAAIAAGYPSASASARASELLKDPRILERINVLLAEKMAKEGVEALKVIKELSRSSSQKDAVRLRAAQMLVQLAGITAKAQADLEEARRKRDDLPKTRTEMLSQLADYLVKLREFNAGHVNTVIPMVWGAEKQPEPAPKPEKEPDGLVGSTMWRARHKGGGRKKAEPVAEPAATDAEEFEI